MFPTGGDRWVFNVAAGPTHATGDVFAVTVIFDLASIWFDQSLGNAIPACMVEEDGVGLPQPDSCD